MQRAMSGSRRTDGWIFAPSRMNQKHHPSFYCTLQSYDRQTDHQTNRQIHTETDTQTHGCYLMVLSNPVFLTCLSPLDQDLFKVGTDRKRYRDRYNPGTSLYFPLSYFRWLCISIVVFVFVYLYSSWYIGAL